MEMNWLRSAWSGTTRVPTALLVAFLLLSALEWLPDRGGSANWDGVRGVLFVALLAFLSQAFILILRRE